jgi:hypothetical protein
MLPIGVKLVNEIVYRIIRTEPSPMQAMNPLGWALPNRKVWLDGDSGV